MDFGFNEEQEQLRAIVRDYLNAETPVTYARAMMDDERGYTDAAWQSMAELGWLGLSVPERFGGSGLGCLETALVAEAMGTVVLPGPWFATVAMGLAAWQAAADEAQSAQVLPEVARGEHRLALAVAEGRGSWAGADLALEARADDDGWVLDGEKLFVADARNADTILVAARTDGGIGLFALAPDTAGLVVEPMRTIDATRKLDVVRLSDVRAGSSALLGGRALAVEEFDRVIDVAKTMAAAELAGLAERALALTVDYLAVREQFGRALATFQALQHRCADMKVDLENVKSLVYYAAWALDEGAEDAALAAAMAKALASETVPRIIADAIQLHGGVGFTWEHDLHLYFKRAKASEVTFGDASFQRELVAGKLGLEAAAAAG